MSKNKSLTIPTQSHRSSHKVLCAVLMAVLMMSMLTVTCFATGTGTGGGTDMWTKATEIMQDVYGKVAEIHADFAGYGANDTMTLNDPYSVILPHDSTRIICEYSALTDFEKTIKVNDLTKKLTEFSDNFFFYMVVEEAKIKTTPVPNEDGTYTEVQTP